MSRPLHAWPAWLLRWLTSPRASLVPFARGLMGEAWLELYQREVVEPALAACDEDSGPWAVSPPEGMQ